MHRNTPRLLIMALLSLIMINATVPQNILSSDIQINSIGSAALLNPAKIIFQEVTSGLTNPVFMTNASDGSGRLFILERGGKIRIVKNGVLLPTPFLNIQSMIKAGSGEQGLLGLAFHPSYGTNGEFFVVYTAPKSGDSTGSNLVLKRFVISTTDVDQADADSGEILLTIAHPTYSNHNGGTLAFGQDGYLYWSTGDGGGAGDPGNNAQSLSKLLGKILRIDVNGAMPYEIPVSNPFYSDPNTNKKKEIWAYGLRNPWRFSFDKLTHDLYIGDVGQGSQEEIDYQPASSAGGQNYGWRVMEANLCFNPSSGCNKTGKTLPVTYYSHTVGCAVTGGYVYRGISFPSLYGYYLYGDYCTGRFFALYRNSNSGWDAVKSIDTPYNISTFGEDEQGELYLADYGTGKIYNIRYIESGPKLIAPEQEQFTKNTFPTFEWSNIPSTDHYELVIASDKSFTSVIDSKIDLTTESYIPVLPLNDGTYYWQVRSINTANAECQWSDYGVFTIDTIPLPALNLNTPADGAITTHRPIFRWTPNTAAAGYQIEIYNDVTLDPLNLLYSTNTKRKSQYQPPSLPAGNYWWRVQVSDRAGNWSDWSEIFTFQVN